MPLWTPETETLEPFDENEELKQKLPQEFVEFIQAYDIPRTFTITIKKWANDNYVGRPVGNYGELHGVIPEMSSIVARYGPGHYGFVTAWTPTGSVKQRSEIVRVNLTGEYWNEIYENAKEEKHAYDLEQAKRKGEIKRARDIAAGITPTTAAEVGTGREYMKSVMGDMKDMMEVFGLQKNSGGGGDANMGMMFMGMMNMMMKQSENTTNMMIALMQNNNKGNDTKEQISIVRELLSLQGGLMPKEQSIISDVVTGIAENLPDIVRMFSRGNRPDDPLHQKLNEGLNPAREQMAASPRFLDALIKHMDRKVGPEMTDKIVDGFLRTNRTPKTPDPLEAENEATDEGTGEGEIE